MTWTPLALKLAAFSVVALCALIVLVQVLAAKREADASAAYPPAGQLIAVNGRDIHVKTVGQGPDIVLVHGASGSMRDFTFELVDRLSDRYRVTTVDRPGLGWSERADGFGGLWSSASESPKDQARVLRQAVLAAEVRNPILLGHSFGGAIALAWALEHPEDTAALVLLGAASNPWPGRLGLYYRLTSTRIGRLTVIPLLTAFTPQSVINSTTASIFAPQTAPEGYLRHFGPEMTLRRATMRANVQHVNSLRPYIAEMSKRYPTLQLPVEILHGTEDTTVPMDVHSEPLSRQIPGAVLTRLQGVGHMPHHADPMAVTTAVDRAAARAGLR